MIGANLQMPALDLSTDQMVDMEEIRRLAAEDAGEIDAQVFFDAFKPLRDMVGGEDPLVSADKYAEVAKSQAKIRAMVGTIQGNAPWAFLAVGGVAGVAPRWVLFEGVDGDPVTDLSGVSAGLRRLLKPEPKSTRMTRQASLLLSRFTTRLDGQRQILLPIRRQRALKLAENVLRAWSEQAYEAQDHARVEVIEHVLACLDPPRPKQPMADLRAFADTWLGLLRPIQKTYFKTRRRKKRLWRLEELESVLREQPIATKRLDEAFANLPTLPPVSERVVAAIICVPGDQASDT